jgi:hypothetical protein
MGLASNINPEQRQTDCSIGLINEDKAFHCILGAPNSSGG